MPIRDLNTTLAIERTVLASERTLLAWYRTAFGVFALALGFGRIVPSLTSASASAAQLETIVGISFALLGVAATIEGMLRYLRSYRRIAYQSEQSQGEVVRTMLEAR